MEQRQTNNKKLLRRLIISQYDLQAARSYASYIVEHKLHSSESDEARTLHSALYTALVVSYCRPFSSKGDPQTANKLPKRFLSGLNTQERRLHNHLIELRHTEIAHSDSVRHQLDGETFQLGYSTYILPISRSTDIPLSLDHTARALQLIDKIESLILAEKERIKKELGPGVKF